MIKCNPSNIYIELLSNMKESNFTKDFTKNFTKNFTKLQNSILEIIQENPEIAQSNLAKNYI